MYRVACSSPVQPYPDAWIVAIVVIKLKHVQLQCHVKESTMNKSGFLACSLLCLFYSFRLSPTDQSRLQVYTIAVDLRSSDVLLI